MGDTSIAWTDKVWNPVTGCTKVSAGCKNCYAERIFHRPYPGRAFTDVCCHSERLDWPLRWRKPRRIFVNSMSDLFHEDVPDEFIDQIVAVAVLTQQHIYQALTKRADRMIKYWTTPDREAWIAKAVLDLLGPKHAVGLKLPLPNWWQGVSVEDQVTADSRIPLLLQTPAATRFVSYEPALGPVDFRWGGMSMPDYAPHRPLPQLDWVIVGGESGHNARAFDIEWARATITQCKKAGVACFVKQLGARPYVADPSLKINTPFRYMPKYADDETGQAWVQLCDRPGTDPSEWPEDLRVQEFPL